ncbi:hypothetical protein, partial [Erwinia sp.]|uniref:hypothetical protein n=1 Tax=Erwinia citreus TaxID=558 RepID=UPI00289A9FD6
YSKNFLSGLKKERSDISLPSRENITTARNVCALMILCQRRGKRHCSISALASVEGSVTVASVPLLLSREASGTLPLFAKVKVFFNGKRSSISAAK